MRSRFSLMLLCAAALVALLADGAFAQSDADVDARIDAMIGDHVPFREAFDALQAAIADEDAEAFAAYVPVGEPVNIDGEATVVADTDAFLARYDEIVTPDIADVIAGQAYAGLFVNDQGVMFGNGEVWLGAVCRDDACATFDVQIIAIQSAGD